MLGLSAEGDPPAQVYRIKRSGEPAGVAPQGQDIERSNASVKETPSPDFDQADLKETAVLYHWRHSQPRTAHPNAAPIDVSTYLDHGVLADILKRYVTKSGWVNYRGLLRDKRRRKKLTAYIRDLSAIDPNTLEHPSDRIAGWLNLYNAIVIDEVLKHYPIRSLMQIKNYFGEKKYKIGEETYSLLDIEQKVFKEKIADPRTLFARVNGASSGPRLPQEPFEAVKLDTQLNERTWKFLADRANVDYDPKRSMLILNPVFMWYQEEFVNLPEFLHSYLDLLPKYYGVSFSAYDWQLNDEKLH